jgi:hypothetical protein
MCQAHTQTLMLLCSKATTRATPLMVQFHELNIYLQVQLLPSYCYLLLIGL